LPLNTSNLNPPTHKPSQNQPEETIPEDTTHKQPNRGNAEEEEDHPPSTPEQNKGDQTKSQKKSNSRINSTRILTQTLRGLPTEDDTKLKFIINQMKPEHWEAACLQETWRLGSDDIHIDDYHIFFQGNSMKTNAKGCVMGGECIILSPTFDKVHKQVERK
jgi:hypothetical protein